MTTWSQLISTRWPSSGRATITQLGRARSIFWISPTCTRAGGEHPPRRAEDVARREPPVIISPTKPWNVWKLSPDDDGQVDLAGGDGCGSALQTLMAT